MNQRPTPWLTDRLVCVRPGQTDREAGRPVDAGPTTSRRVPSGNGDGPRAPAGRPPTGGSETRVRKSIMPIREQFDKTQCPGDCPLDDRAFPPVVEPTVFDPGPESVAIGLRPS